MAKGAEASTARSGRVMAAVRPERKALPAAVLGAKEGEGGGALEGGTEGGGGWEKEKRSGVRGCYSGG
jgi:hypothetical protein